MSNLLSRFILVATTSAILFSTPLQAQSLTAAQDKLIQLQTEQSSMHAQIKKLDDLITGKKAELVAAKAKPSPERDELLEAEKELAEARATHSANPSDMNQTSLKNAELKHHLAERKFHKSSAAIEELQDEIQRSESQRNTLQNALTVNKSQIEQQKITVNKAAITAEAEKQAAIQRKQLAEKEAALQAENARELAKKQAEQAALAKINAEKLAAEEAAKKAAQNNNGLTKLSDKAAIANELNRFNSLPDDNRIKTKVNQFMYVHRDGAAKKNSYVLRDLGHSHYRTELTAGAGKATINIGFRKWDITFDNADAGNTYVFIYDQSNTEKPRLIYFLKSLE